MFDPESESSSDSYSGVPCNPEETSNRFPFRNGIRSKFWALRASAAFVLLPSNTYEEL